MHSNGNQAQCERLELTERGLSMFFGLSCGMFQSLTEGLDFRSLKKLQITSEGFEFRSSIEDVVLQERLDGSPLPPIIAASVEAVESYGWQDAAFIEWQKSDPCFS